jgi:hypothetical protein
MPYGSPFKKTGKKIGVTASFAVYKSSNFHYFGHSALKIFFKIFFIKNEKRLDIIFIFWYYIIINSKGAVGFSSTALFFAQRRAFSAQKGSNTRAYFFY